jgi:hypothetical protein
MKAIRRHYPLVTYVSLVQGKAQALCRPKILFDDPGLDVPAINCKVCRAAARRRGFPYLWCKR